MKIIQPGHKIELSDGSVAVVTYVDYFEGAYYGNAKKLGSDQSLMWWGAFRWNRRLGLFRRIGSLASR